MTAPDPHPGVRRPRRWPAPAIVLGGLAVLVALGLLALAITQDPAEADPLGPGARAVDSFTMRGGQDCGYDAAAGGLVAHVDVSTRSSGRFTIEVEAVTEEGVGDLDVTTPYAARYTVAFHGGRSRKQFDVVVPMPRAAYDAGRRSCRYTVNPPD